MKKGQRYIITCGEYSDYGIRDSFVALRDFSFDLALDAWLAKHEDPDFPRRFSYEEGSDEQAFLAWLRSEGYVADEALHKVHLTDYGRAEPSPANDAADEPAEGEAGRP